MRFAAIARHRGIWPLRWMCETLQVTTAGFYAWLQRPESERARVDRKLTAAIRTSLPTVTAPMECGAYAAICATGVTAVACVGKSFGDKWKDLLIAS